MLPWAKNRVQKSIKEICTLFLFRDISRSPYFSLSVNMIMSCLSWGIFGKWGKTGVKHKVPFKYLNFFPEIYLYFQLISEFQNIF